MAAGLLSGGAAPGAPHLSLRSSQAGSVLRAHQAAQPGPCGQRPLTSSRDGGGVDAMPGVPLKLVPQMLCTPLALSLAGRGPDGPGEGQRLWEPPLSAPQHRLMWEGLPWASGPGVQDPQGPVPPVQGGWNLGSSSWGHAVPPLSPATSLHPTWPDLPAESLLTVGPRLKRSDVLGQRRCLTVPCWVLQGPAVCLHPCPPFTEVALTRKCQGTLVTLSPSQPALCPKRVAHLDQVDKGPCPRWAHGLPQAWAGTRVLLPASPGEALGGRAADSAGSGSPPATHSSRTGQSLEPTAHGGTWARGSGGLQERKALRRGLSHEPLLTPWRLAAPPCPGRAASAGSAGGGSVVHPSSQDNRSCPVGCEPWGPQSLLAPGPGRLPDAPTQEGCPSPGAPTATRLEDGSLCWLPHPLGAGRGLAPAAPASGPGPACLRARLLPSALHSWPHLQPQIPAALEAGCSLKGTQLRNSPSHLACRGLSPQPSGLTQVASAPRGGGDSGQGGSWTAHPTCGRSRAALFGRQTRGNKVPAHQAPEGRWPLVLGETQTLFWRWGTFWVSGTLLLQVFEPRA